MARQASPAQEKAILLVVGTIFTLAGMGVLWYGIDTVREASASKSWPTTQGIITRSEVRQQKQPSGGGSSSFIAEVSYEYKVDSLSYRNDRISRMDFGTSNRSSVREKKKKYPLGKEVVVFYNPANPLDALLEPGWGWIQAIPLGLGAAFSLAGLSMLWRWLGRMSRSGPEVNP